jgi:hypothetical protein
VFFEQIYCYLHGLVDDVRTGIESRPILPRIPKFTIHPLTDPLVAQQCYKVCRLGYPSSHGPARSQLWFRLHFSNTGDFPAGAIRKISLS